MPCRSRVSSALTPADPTSDPALTSANYRRCWRCRAPQRFEVLACDLNHISVNIFLLERPVSELYTRLLWQPSDCMANFVIFVVLLSENKYDDDDEEQRHHPQRDNDNNNTMIV